MRCSRLMMARSRQMDWMELKMPTQMQAHTRAKAPFLVSCAATKVFSPVTEEMISVMMAALISTFHPFSFRNIRKHLPT